MADPGATNLVVWLWGRIEWVFDRIEDLAARVYDGIRRWFWED